LKNSTALRWLASGLLALTPTLMVGVVPATALVRAPAPRVLPVSAAASSIVGYGSKSVGGNGGRTIIVRNKKDSGFGSLRRALEGSRGRRIVKFAVQGTITLQSPLHIKWPYITVNGGAAPGKGIQIKGNPIVVVTHDVILRNLRVRPGDALMSSGEAGVADGLTINGVNKSDVYNIVLDNMSMLWGPDIGGLAILGNAHDITVQDGIIGEGLRYSRHPEGRLGGGGHSMGINLARLSDASSPQRVTFFRNLITTSNARMPRFEGASCVDLVNNLIYNWGELAASGNPSSANIVNNWFRWGPRSITHYWWRVQTSNDEPSKHRDSVYTSGNKLDGFRGRRSPDSVAYASTPRCGGLSKQPNPVSSVWWSVLSNAGARVPAVDSVDRRVLYNVRHRLGKFFNGVDFPAPNPYWPPL
jgi:hypothetical protein